MIRPEDLSKVMLIDQVLAGMTLEDVKSLLESDILVGKLRAHDNSPGVILSAMQDVSLLQMEIITLRSEYSALKNDFTQLIRAANTIATHVPYSPELQGLKTKYSVY